MQAIIIFVYLFIIIVMLLLALANPFQYECTIILDHAFII